MEKLKPKNIFKDAADCVASSEGTLAKLFRKIVVEDKIIHRLPQWIEDYAERTEETTNGKSKCRHNMSTHIRNKSMTIKSFINIFHNVIRAKKIDINISIHYKNGIVTNHGETINLDDDMEDEEIEETINAEKRKMKNEK